MWATLACLGLSLAAGWLPGLDLLHRFGLLLFVSVGPGLAFVAWLGGVAGPGWRVIGLSLALSPGVVTVVTLPLVTGLGLETRAAAWLAVAAAGAALAALAWRWRHAVGPSVPGEALEAKGAGDGWRSWPEGLWAAIPGGVLALCAILVFSLLGNRISYHGVLHAGFVAQIATGLVPPENPALAGAPGEFYWLYHWLLAVYADLTGFSILTTAPWIDVWSVLVFGGVGYALARRVFEPPRAALAGTVLGFVGNATVPLVFVVRATLEGVPEAPYWPMSLIHLGYWSGEPRIVTLLAKFFAVGGFPIGLALWAIALEELAPGRGRETNRVVLFSVLASLIAFHPTTALGAYVSLAGAHFAHAIRRPADVKISVLWRRNAPAAAAFLAALLVTLPYTLSIGSGGQGASLLSVAPTGILQYNLSTLFLGATPVVAILLVTLRAAFRSPFVGFAWWSAAILVSAGVLWPLPDNNQYKLLAMAFLPAGALLLGSLARLRRTWSSYALAAVAALTLASHAITVVGHLTATSARRSTFRGDGPFLRLPEQPSLDGALLWLRQNTAPDAVVVGPLVRYGGSPIRAVSGRSPYVLLGGHHTEARPEFAARASALQALLTPRTRIVPAAARLRDSMDRPLYVLVRREDDAESFEALASRFARSSTLFTEVYRAQDVALYRLERRDDGERGP